MHVRPQDSPEKARVGKTMVFQVEKSDRLEISGGTLDYILKLSFEILRFSIASILVLLIGTLPAAAIGLMLSPVASGLYLIIVIALATRLGMVLLNYDIRIQGATISGARSDVTDRPEWLRLGLLSAGGLNLLIIVSVIVGTLAATVAPPIIFMSISAAALVGNELIRKKMDTSISIIGVKITKVLYEKVPSLSARERRELSQLATAAEWIATSLTAFGHIETPTIQA